MLDIQFIRDNAELVAQKAKQKGYEVDISKLLDLDNRRRELIVQIDELRQKRNEQAHSTKDQKPGEQQIAVGKDLKEKIAELDKEFADVSKEMDEHLRAVPNVFPDDTPLGGEEANREEKQWGNTEPKKFKLVDHLNWGEQRGLIDFGRGAKVSGNKFYFLKGALVQLELAVFQYTLQLTEKYGFTPMMVPNMVKTRVIEGTGYSAKGEEKQIYKIEGEDLNLIATSEIPITGYHADEILQAKDLPILYAGLSPAYRVEGGAYGKHNKGLFRTHQFNKLELYVFCKPEDSEHWHQELIAIEEELCRALEIPYRLVRIAAGDMGAPAYKKFDVEYWSPVDQAYRELMSCSNVTDYQARRLNIRYRGEKTEKSYVHTLNGTAAAMSRIPIALIENHQQKDGKVQIPAVLRPYMGGLANI